MSTASSSRASAFDYEQTVEHRPLGRTGVSVNKLCLPPKDRRADRHMITGVSDAASRGKVLYLRHDADYGLVELV